jgi:hypothetical protein
MIRSLTLSVLTRTLKRRAKLIATLRVDELHFDLKTSMKNRGLIIAALVLAALLGLLYWSNRHPRSDNSNTAVPTPSEPAPNILTLNEGDINKIELRKKGGDQIVVTKDSNGKWQITSPKSIGVDDSAIASMLSTLSSLNSERLVEEKAANLGQYGLAEPKLEVDIADKNNTARKLLIGDDTPTGSGAYAQLAGDPRVFTIATFTKTSLDKGLNDLRDKRLITAEADKITRLELSAKQQTIEFSRDKEQWQILKPKPLRADGAKVDELVSKITDAKMDLTSASSETANPSPTPVASPSKAPTPAIKNDPASAFASGSAIATVKVTTDSGTQQIEVRKNKDDYYAKSSIADGVYKVAAELGQALDKKLDDFRNKKVFDFGTSDPSKIEIHDGSKTYILSKSGDDWTAADGKRYEKAGVDAIIGKLRDLQASEFADSGFGAAALQVTITSEDGKRTEKVSLSKSAKNTLARREGESSLYVLNANSIEDIQKLLSDLKS